MVSGPLAAPPSLWKNGKSQPGGLGRPFSQRSALLVLEGEKRGEGGSSENGWGMEGGAHFLLCLWEGMAEPQLPRPWLGLSISP